MSEENKAAAEFGELIAELDQLIEAYQKKLIDDYGLLGAYARITGFLKASLIGNLIEHCTAEEIKKGIAFYQTYTGVKKELPSSSI